MTPVQTKLIENNHNLIYAFLRKHNLNIDEYYDLAAIGFCKAAISFNNDVSNFSTYSFKCMETEYIQHLRRINAYKRMSDQESVSLYKSVGKDQDGKQMLLMDMIPGKDSTETEAIEDVYFNEFLSEQNERNKQILQLAFNGLKQKQIMKIVGLSQPQVSKILSKMKAAYIKNY